MRKLYKFYTIVTCLFHCPHEFMLSSLGYNFVYIKHAELYDMYCTDVLALLSLLITQ